VATVGHLPESNLRIARKIDVLGAISDKLHKSTSHLIILLLKKIILSFCSKLLIQAY
jgi:hypothetical protein